MYGNWCAACASAALCASSVKLDGHDLDVDAMLEADYADLKLVANGLIAIAPPERRRNKQQKMGSIKQAIFALSI